MNGKSNSNIQNFNSRESNTTKVEGHEDIKQREVSPLRPSIKGE
jgi:hypothetical protein